MLLIIDWIIICAAAFSAGATVGYFWDEITQWATRAIGYILDRINRAIQVTSDAIVYLVKEGRRYYKKVEVYARNIYNESTQLLTEKKRNICL